MVRPSKPWVVVRGMAGLFMARVLWGGCLTSSLRKQGFSVFAQCRCLDGQHQNHRVPAWTDIRLSKDRRNDGKSDSESSEKNCKNGKIGAERCEIIASARAAASASPRRRCPR